MARRSLHDVYDQKSWIKNIHTFQNIPRFFGMVWKTNKGYFLINLIFRLIKSIIPVVMLWVGKLIIDEVILQSSTPDPSFNMMWIYLGFELGLAILSDVTNRIIQLTDGLLGDLYSNKSSVELMQKAAAVDLQLLEDPDFYDKLERARRQTNNRVTLMTNVLGQIQDIITVVSLIAGLVAFAPWLILLLIVAIIPSFINEIKFSNISYSLVRSWTTERRELDYLRYIGANDETAKEIKLFGLADFISNRFDRLADKYYQANKKLAIRRSLWGSLFHLLGDVAYYGAYVLIIIDTVNGQISVGELTFLAGSFNRLRNQLQTIFSRFSRITESALYLKDYFDFIDLEIPSDRSKDLMLAPQHLEGAIKFENVSFTYPRAEKPVLSNLTFTIRKGEKIALVGQNGAGKTTLIKLLMRMYEPSSGTIYLNGVDISRYDRNAYQQLFGAIFQDYIKYYFTAKENIGVGKVQELSNQERIEDSAQKSLAHELIKGLEQNYATQLGRRFGKGKDLSGGEWQKIALARAYMKDPEIIILDEPTSSLDAKAEYEVFQRFIDLTENKTSIIISHRFSTVRLADRIIVLKDGNIFEQGTHEDLLTQEGLYAEMFQLQAKGYL